VIVLSVGVPLADLSVATVCDHVTALILRDTFGGSLGFGLGVMVGRVLAVPLASNSPSVWALHHMLISHFSFSSPGKSARPTIYAPVTRVRCRQGCGYLEERVAGAALRWVFTSTVSPEYDGPRCLIPFFDPECLCHVLSVLLSLRQGLLDHPIRIWVLHTR